MFSEHANDERFVIKDDFFTKSNNRLDLGLMLENSYLFFC